MAHVRIEPITLDYRDAKSGRKDLRESLSGVAVAGRYLWTASDEGRSVECLEPHGSGYRLREQYSLDKRFEGIPGERFDAEKPDEIDIESLCVADNALWICASHCRVRLKPDDEVEAARPHWKFRTRHSRHFLGRVDLKDDGGALAEHGKALPFKGRRSLRRRLGRNRFLKPFIDLPSKENGLDIEGMTTRDGRRLLLGLRGPLVNNIAVVLEIGLTEDIELEQTKPVMHFLTLDGLAVRDLAPAGEDVIILAGPVASKHGPFRLYGWRPGVQRDVQSANLLHSWPEPSDPLQPTDHPEAICVLSRNGEEGLFVLYDNPQEQRMPGTRYTADWLVLA